MPSIHIEDVPDDVHATMRRRAATAGMSLQEHLLGCLASEARSPTLHEVLDRADGRSGGRISLEDAVSAVRADRQAQ